MLTVANILGENPWYMDSGSTNHLTADSFQIASTSAYFGGEFDTTSNGAGMSILRSGSSVILVPHQQFHL